MVQTDYLDLYQVCDSTFPIGSFNHSFGMEHYIFEGHIKTGRDFQAWLDAYYSTQFVYGEGLLVKLVYEALDEADFGKVLRYDQLLDASMIARETRVGTRLIARQMLTLLDELYGSAISQLKTYQDAIGDGYAYGNPAVAFAILAHAKELPQEEAFKLYAYSVAGTLVQNAVRAVPLGQKEGQKILKALLDQLTYLYERVLALGADDLGANLPGLELAQIRHEHQTARLFMS